MFMPGLQVELDDETRRKLEAAGMGSVFDGSWRPAPVVDGPPLDAGSSQPLPLGAGFGPPAPVFDMQPGSIDHKPPGKAAEANRQAAMAASRIAASRSALDDFDDAADDEDNSAALAMDVPDYLKVAAGAGTARTSRALQRGMPSSSSFFGATATAKTTTVPPDGPAAPLPAEDLSRGIESLLSRPAPKFDALSTGGSAEARRLRQARSDMRRKSSMGKLHAVGASSASGKTYHHAADGHRSGSGFPGDTSRGDGRGGGNGDNDGGFDYEKLRQAQEFAAQFELSEVDTEKMMRGAGGKSGGGSATAGAAMRRSGKGNRGSSRSSGKRRGKSSKVSDTYRKGAAGMSRSGRGKGTGRGRSSGSLSRKTAEASTSSGRNVSSIDVEALSRNFREGTELQRLRAELAESQASHANSSEFLAQAKDWFK